MTRVRKLALAAGAWAVLTAGSGCGAFDAFTDDDEYGHVASYSREAPPPMTQQVQARPPADITTGANVPTQAGIYPDTPK